ncbi:MAG: hypothetical protein ACOVNU_08075 [Candidatus Kapaibacteriota bacterium]
MYNLSIRKKNRRVTTSSDSNDQMMLDKETTVYESCHALLFKMRISDDSIGKIMTAYYEANELIGKAHALGMYVIERKFHPEFHAKVEKDLIYESETNKLVGLEGEYTFELKNGMRGLKVVNFRNTDKVVPYFALKPYGVYVLDGWASEEDVDDYADIDIHNYIKNAFPISQWDERYM